MSENRSREYLGVAIIAFATALMAFDQGSLSYLMPFIKPELELNNAQVGLLMSGYWVAFGISSFFIGPLSARTGNPKLLFFWIVAAYGVLSTLSGFAISFITLIGARIIMGFCQGALFPMAQAILALDTPPERRGTYMGIVASMAPNSFGLFVAPLVLVQIATLHHWRTGFFVVIVPALICAALIYKFVVRRSSASARQKENVSELVDQSTDVSLKDAFKYRNFWVCSLLCSLFLAYLSLGLAFHPLYLIDQRGYPSQSMSVLMSVIGLSAVVFALALPVLSDHIGRKATLSIACAVSMIAPFAIMFYSGPVAIFGILLFIGCIFYATGSIIMGTVPSESVPLELAPTVIGVVVAIGVITGGLIGPSIAGWGADKWGLDFAIWGQVACAAIAAVLALLLKETAPKFSDKTV